MVRVVDVAADKPTCDASDENVGGEVLFRQHATDADRACEAVDRGLRKPAWIFAGDDGGHRPSHGGVVRGERSVVPAGTEEVSGCVVDRRPLAAEDELHGLVDSQAVYESFAG